MYFVQNCIVMWCNVKNTFIHYTLNSSNALMSLFYFLSINEFGWKGMSLDGGASNGESGWIGRDWGGAIAPCSSTHTPPRLWVTKILKWGKGNLFHFVDSLCTLEERAMSFQTSHTIICQVLRTVFAVTRI